MSGHPLPQTSTTLFRTSTTLLEPPAPQAAPSHTHSPIAPTELPSWVGDLPMGLGTPYGRRLVALDIDGTTVRHDGTMSTHVRDAVRRTASAGHHVVIATGRSVLGTLPVLRDLGLDRGYAVCSNGAVTIAVDGRRLHGFRVVRNRTFRAAPILDRLRDAWPDAQVAVEVVGRGYDVSSPFSPGELDGRIRVRPWEDLAARPVTRVTFRSTTGTSDDFIAMTERLGLHEVSYAVGYTAWLDIAAQGVSKASGLEGVRRKLRVPSARTVAVGDQRNDLEMLDWAACGVAMGNAPAEVTAVADAVTAHVDEDGLTLVLRALPSMR